jgi:Family of unknown function (DUF6536)
MGTDEMFPTALTHPQMSSCSSSTVENEREAASLQDVEFKSKETWSTDTTSIVDSSNDGGYDIPLTERRQLTEFLQVVLAYFKAVSHQTANSIKRSGNRNSTSDSSLPLRSRTTSGKFSSYKGGLLVATITCGTILILNLIFVPWSAGAFSKDGFKWSGVISKGSHQKINRLNTMLHFLINTLTTLLLASSNYTLQLLSSPTRGEVDRAHQRGWHLDIGILSIRNLHLGYNTTIMVFLILSSLPISFL